MEKVADKSGKEVVIKLWYEKHGICLASSLTLHGKPGYIENPTFEKVMEKANAED